MTDQQFGPQRVPAKGGAKAAPAAAALLPAGQTEKIAAFVGQELQKSLIETETFKEYREYFAKKPVRLAVVAEEGTAKMRAGGSIAISAGFLLDVASKAAKDGMLSQPAIRCRSPVPPVPRGSF